MRTARVCAMVVVVGLTAAFGLIPAADAAAPTSLPVALSSTSSEPTPTVSGPITGGLRGGPWFSAPFGVGGYGYSEEEYFYSGTASAYGASAAPASYTTRMLVYRPTDPAKFSGTVDVEWNNVTGQMDLPVEFVWLHPQVFAAGDAYVEISAQQAGVCGVGLTGAPVLGLGGASLAACTPESLKGFDPARYAPLVHPGNDYSYDIFSQGAQALRNPRGVAPLGGLPVRRMIALGESQSAIALDVYLDHGADAAAQVFDGFLIDADAHAAMPSSFRVPTVHLWSEESAHPVESTAGPNHVIWSVAGAAHTDASLLEESVPWLGHSLLATPVVSRQQEEASEWSSGDYGEEGPGASATCAGDTEFPRRYAIDAALTDLQTWVTTGRAAPSAPPFSFTGVAAAVEPLPAAPPNSLFPPDTNGAGLGLAPLELVRDQFGNAVGGVRLPLVTTPVASYDGNLCVLLGVSVPLLPTQLLARYPTHEDYVRSMVADTQAAVAARYLTASDGIDLVQRACNSAIPLWGATPPDHQPQVCGDVAGVVEAAASP